MCRIVLLALLVPLLSPGLALGRQTVGAPPPRPEQLLRAWRDSQRQAARQVGWIGFEQVVRRRNDFAGREVQATVRSYVYGDPSTKTWEREILEAERNGRNLPPSEVERFEGSRRGPGEMAERMVYPPAFELRPFERMEPAGRTTPDQLNERPVWRIELVGRPPEAGPERGRQGRPERLTLWFSRDQPPRLIRAHLLSRPMRSGIPAVHVTDFGPFEGLDVPLRSEVEMMMVQRRRIRSFTGVSELTITFSDYHRSTPP